MLEPVLDRKPRGLSGRPLIALVSAATIGMFGEYMRVPGALGLAITGLVAYLWHWAEKPR